MRKDISLDKKATHYCKHCGLTMRPDDLFECEACDGDLCEPRKKESIKRTRRKGAEVKPVDLYEVRFKSSKTPRSPGHPLDPSFYPFDTKVSSIWYTGSSYQVDCAGLPVFHLSRSDMGWLRQYVILPKATKVPNWGGRHGHFQHQFSNHLRFDTLRLCSTLQRMTRGAVSVVSDNSTASVTSRSTIGSRLQKSISSHMERSTKSMMASEERSVCPRV